MYRRKGQPVNKSSLCAFIIESESLSCSVISNSLRPHGLSMEFSGKNTGVGSNSLLQGIFPTQGSNPGLLHYRWILDHLRHQGSPLDRNRKLSQRYGGFVLFLRDSQYHQENTFKEGQYLTERNLGVTLIYFMAGDETWEGKHLQPKADVPPASVELANQEAEWFYISKWLKTIWGRGHIKIM